MASGLHDGLVAELVIRHTRYALLPLEPVYAYVNGKQHRLLRNRDVRVPIGVGRVRLFVASGPDESGVWEGRLGADDRVELEFSSDRPTPPGQPHPWAVDQLSGPAMVEVQPGRSATGFAWRALALNVALLVAMLAVWNEYLADDVPLLMALAAVAVPGLWWWARQNRTQRERRSLLTS